MHRNLGAAIDVGTTTVALRLINIGTGETLSETGEINAQSLFGDDVTSRIKYCIDNGQEKLTTAIRKQIESMIIAACDASGVSFNDIEKVSIAANTVMQHLVAGYSPVPMGAAPYNASSLFGEMLPIWEGMPVSNEASIYYTPAISSYVGGDITAGLLAAGFADVSDTALFIDIGTNGEIMLKHNGTYYCCATAAGPAFEGAGISNGMAAVEGAIDHFWFESSDLCYSVIGTVKPQGICGSGLLDLLSILLDINYVDKTGRLLSGDKHYLTGEASDIYITAGDIRNLQLAKAAIAAGIQVLLHYAGVEEFDVKLLALAGGFGSRMSLESAARVGLFPKTLLPVAKAYGNTAGEGAALSLYMEDSHNQLISIRKHSEYIELSSYGYFNEKFVEEMRFAQ